VLGPVEPFRSEELASLQRYADRGGSLLIALEPEGKANNEELASIAGLTFKPGILCNPEHYAIRRQNPSDRGFIYSSRFSMHPSVSTLRKAGSRAVFFINSGAVEKTNGAVGKIDNVVSSMMGTWADLDGNYVQDPQLEQSFIYHMVAAVTRPALVTEAAKSDDAEKPKDDAGNEAKEEKKEEKKETRIVVVADSDALSDALLMNQSNLNGNPYFVLDAQRWLGGDEAFVGAATTDEDVRIEHTRQEDKLYFYLIIFGAPALVLGFGLLSQSLRRRSARNGRTA
jgi:hypothetical protein